MCSALIPLYCITSAWVECDMVAQHRMHRAYENTSHGTKQPTHVQHCHTTSPQQRLWIKVSKKELERRKRKKKFFSLELFIDESGCRYERVRYFWNLYIFSFAHTLQPFAARSFFYQSTRSWRIVIKKRKAYSAETIALHTSMFYSRPVGAARKIELNVREFRVAWHFSSLSVRSRKLPFTQLTAI